MHSQPRNYKDDSEPSSVPSNNAEGFGRIRIPLFLYIDLKQCSVTVGGPTGFRTHPTDFWQMMLHSHSVSGFYMAFSDFVLFTDSLPQSQILKHHDPNHEADVRVTFSSPLSFAHGCYRECQAFPGELGEVTVFL